MKKVINISQLIILTTIILLTSSCKDYYNDMIDWTSNIKTGTDINKVKKNQPNFLKIDWDNPDTLETRIRYEIIEIKGNRDILKMQNFVVFENKKYVGRESQK